MIRTALIAVFLFLAALPARAQDSWWVQIAARPTLSAATDFAREAATQISGIHGFYLGNGFYAIAIGPFDRSEADQTRSRLLNARAIPSDSFVKDSRSFDQQFWPIGGAITAPAVALAPAPLATATLPDETPREARASESTLTRDERELLQTALQWAGFYDAAIDGAFGRGTRAAMEAWQLANAAEPTGILTTRQRADLVAQYNAVLTALDLQTTTETAAGIEMLIPKASVVFTEYQPPFVKYEASSDAGSERVLLISQAGDAAQLRGLYEVMQSLDIVPVEGERSFWADRFVIEGRDENIISYTEANLSAGEIKGFTLVWPSDDLATYQRLRREMQASFARLTGTLDPAIAPPSEDQSVDMVAGLAIRQPTFARSGFYVSQSGHVLTSYQGLDQCSRITVAEDLMMRIEVIDEDLGLALLTPPTAQSPRAVAQIDTAVPRLRDRVAVAGFPFGGVLADPTLTFGTLADLRNLKGDPSQARLELTAQPSDAGGPILNSKGHVIGMLLTTEAQSQQTLPEGVSFAVKSADIAAFLTTAGLNVAPLEQTDALSPVAQTRLAADLGVLVSCW
ncbi:trypsin-like peptidase domain-containing protein [Yoonia litorea]|uniref:Putative peptidoglycan binding domain-containing protein n=1 Tax=Yoonia litorea TaxID=1123755 RepID=A0A1I6MEQ4_9RHOB|nr:trypsin-like peptidase domain-containing protein [Yoonia litorea]SFS14219.1 Putative peptidoglycan binding domain-containing protein [Yoonia litorea]